MRANSRMWRSWPTRNAAPKSSLRPDFSGSTTAMIRFVEQTAKPHYLLLTECSMGDNVAAANPHLGYAARYAART